MDINNATEVAYKNDYEAGYKTGYEVGKLEAEKKNEYAKLKERHFGQNEKRLCGEWILVDKREEKFEGAIFRVVFKLKCSSCGRISNYTSNYCPACGAKMKGGDEK